MNEIRVASYGLGPIGRSAAGLLLEKHGVELVGAVDIDPDKTGKDLGELLGRETPMGIEVSGDVAEMLARCKPDVVVHCTTSFLELVEEQLVQLANAGVNVVSSSEELLVPDLQHPEIAARIDAAAREGGVTVLGTGVNPGFVMDFLAVVSSAACRSVESVRCERVVDAGTRRLPLQKKVGAGLSREEFAARQRAGRFGHIGLRESVALVGRGLGLELDAIEQNLEPVIAAQDLETEFLTLRAGAVAGIHNVGHGLRGGERRVELDLKMYVGAPDPHDTLRLQGSPDLELSFPRGIPGDAATAAILVNSLAQVVSAPAGLVTVLEIPPPRLLR